MIKKFVAKIVDTAGTRPWTVLLCALLTIVGTWTYASRLELRVDFLDLLPRDSAAFKAFEHQLGRVGGGATLFVVAESPNRAANEKFIDAITAKLNGVLDERKKCEELHDTDVNACGPPLISYLETGTKDVRAYFEGEKWLYADLDDLENADETLDHQIAIGSGLVSNLDDEPAPPPPGAAIADAGAPDPNAKKPALGMDVFLDRWKARANEHDDFPTGYFATPDGHLMAIRIVSPTTGTGDRGGDLLLAEVKQLVAQVNPAAIEPQLTVGYAGDIPNAIEERESLLSDAAWASGFALVAIVCGIVFFFRSAWSLIVIILPVIVGIGCAYSFAMLTYGYINQSGAFLGAIILGNGINYPIVLLARYREFRARGQAPDEARRDAVWNAFRAELVGAAVGAIAYGSLIVTQFRGFKQFGMIGFVGMLLVWIAMIPCVPALIVLIERAQERLPPWLRDPQLSIQSDGSQGWPTRMIAKATEKAPWLFLGFAAAVTVYAAVKLPPYIRDPWEYNFVHLGSKDTRANGAGAWSTKADQVFGGRMNVAGARMLADTAAQVPAVKAQIIKNDQADPEGRLIADVATVLDLLPGTPEQQKKKLEVLDRIRDRLTPAVIASLPDDEKSRVDQLRPPESLRPLAPVDLPALLRRRFEENNGTIGTVLYVRVRNDISLSDGRNLLRIARSTDNVQLPDGTIVQTASRSTVFAEIIRSMERDGPLATATSFTCVVIVVVLATLNLRGALAVLLVLVMGVTWTVGGAAAIDMKLNFLNFIALPITFGIGCEYPFNVFDRTRLLGGDVTAAVKRTGGAVALCSYTTTIGYGAMLFSDQQALASFGKLAMSGEIACVFGALFTLPALLHVWKVKAKRPTAL